MNDFGVSHSFIDRSQGASDTMSVTRKNAVAEANGLELHYEAFGSQADPAALLAMGNSAPGLVWPDTFCEMLAAAGIYAIRFDARDTGLSTALSTCRVRDGTMTGATTGQKLVDGFWASSANSRHATNRAASCLR